jgi:phosphatidylglycerophosphatase A
VDALARLIATFFGAGYFPIAPATFASALVAGLLFLLGPGPDPLARGRIVPEALVILLLVPVAVWSAHRAERTLGHDASPIVIDEVVGQAIALWHAPRSWPWVLGGFLLFRLFDIWKPLGANRAQDLPGGFGIVADDVLAGIYAALVLQAFLLWGPGTR